MKKTLIFQLLLAISTVLSAQNSTAAPDGFVRIEGGVFLMGSPENELGRRDRESPQRQVTVSSFYMSIYPVTQQEWYKVMGTTVRQQRDKISRTRAMNGEGDNNPMYFINWLEAIEFCNKRSQTDGLMPVYTVTETEIIWDHNANGYRLPTEAEWEYACRAGTITAFSTGNNITTMQANFNGSHPNFSNDRMIFKGVTITAGSYPSNPWGLYDMHGNVWEWCWDWSRNYPHTAQTDPVGEASGVYKIVRGGSFGSGMQETRSAYRYYYEPIEGSGVIGFRLARDNR